MATKIGPSDLLAAPPQVFEAILELLHEQRQAERQEALKSRLKKSGG
jgi:hypothetical protein